jgi:RHS repeat-associated protein
MDRRVGSVSRPLTGVSGGPTYTFAYTGTTSGSTEVTDANGNATTYQWDDQARVTDVTDALGNSRATEYNANGNVTTYTPTSAASGGTPYTNGYSSDGRNNLTSAALPTGATSTFAYADPDNLYAPSRYTSPQGNTITYDYDAAGNLASVSDPAQGTNSMQRNSDGNVTSMTDPNGNTTRYSYNSKGELTGIDHPGPRGDETLEYDDLSRVVAVIDGKNQRTAYTYDSMDRVMTVTAPGNLTVTYVYDAAGNRTSRGDATGTTTTVLDRLNRVTGENLSVGGSTSYAYDPVGNLTSLTDLGGTVTYTYNPVNLVASLTQPGSGGTGGGYGGEVFTFEYDEDNQRTSTTYPNGMVQDAEYDASGRLTRIGGMGADGDTTLTDFTYSYATPAGADGALRSEVTDHTGQVTTYGYDGVERLDTAVTRDGAGGPLVRAFDYDYDAASNRIRTALTTGSGASASTATTLAAYNGANQVCWTAASTATGTPSCSSAPSRAVSFSYDASGNTTAITGPGSPGAAGPGGVGGGQAYTYNAFDQAVSISPASGSGNGGAAPAEYTDTSHDERVRYSDTVGSTTRQYTNTYSLLGLTTRVQTNPAQTHSYTRDPDGNVLAIRAGTSRSYLLIDGLGSTAALVNTGGYVERRYTYDPYGTTSSTGTGFDANPWRYTGEYQDNNTSNYAIGARYYTPTLGRWTQPDPLEGRVNPAQPAETSPYAYVGCNPVLHRPVGAERGMCTWIRRRASCHSRSLRLSPLGQLRDRLCSDFLCRDHQRIHCFLRLGWWV